MHTKRKRAPAAPTTAEPATSHETHVSTDWGSVLEARQAPITARALDPHKIWLVDELLSEDECAQLLSRAEAHGFGTTHYEPSYRGNLRLTTTDPSLAEAVWARLRGVVPATLTLTRPDSEAERTALWWKHYPDAEGQWEAYGLNECWRLAKYRTGDRFLCHCDEAYVPSSGGPVARMSMLSVNIYMNGGFEAGRTRFFLRDDFESQLEGVSSGSGAVQYHVKESGIGPDVAVVPAAGRCLLFQQPPGQCYYHDGEQLGSECKYLFRSDVMYRRIGPPQRDIR